MENALVEKRERKCGVGTHVDVARPWRFEGLTLGERFSRWRSEGSHLQVITERRLYIFGDQSSTSALCLGAPGRIEIR